MHWMRCGWVIGHGCVEVMEVVDLLSSGQEGAEVGLSMFFTREPRSY